MSDQIDESSVQATTNNGKNLERIKWRNRRKMAWVALISMILLMLVLLFGPISIERITTLKDPIIWFFFSMTSVIGAYMGFTTWASRK